MTADDELPANEEQGAPTAAPPVELTPTAAAILAQLELELKRTAVVAKADLPAAPRQEDRPLVEPMRRTPTPIAFDVPAEGTYPCVQCGGETSRPGICEACGRELRRSAFARELQPAMKSIPARFDWASPVANEALIEDPDIAPEDFVPRCPICKAAGAEGDKSGAPCADEDGVARAGRAHRARLKLARIRAWGRVKNECELALNAGRNIVLLGPKPQVGKTSAGVILLRHVILRGQWDVLPADVQAAYLAPMPRASSGRPFAAERPLPAQVHLARGARYVAARDLRSARHTTAALAARELAKTAPLLLLDDVGDELDSAPQGSGLIPDRIEGTREVVDYRHKRPELRTIYTTWLSEVAMASYYGGGTAKRVYERAAVILVGPQEMSAAKGAA
jgi:hypothetical protein